MTLAVRVAVLGLILSYAVGWGLHHRYLVGIASDHAGHAAPAAHHGGAVPEPGHALNPMAHYLRDSTLAAPFVVGLLLITTLVVRLLLARHGVAADSGAAKLIFAGAVALTAAAGSVPEVLVHGWLFDEHVAGVSFGAQLTGVALTTLRYTFALTLGVTLLFGVPWRGPHREPIKTGELVS